MTVIRLVVPLTILRWPLLGGVLAILADMSDWNILSLKTSQDYAYYQSWDKILDMYYLSLEAWVIMSWRSIFAKKISLFFFIFRLIGVGVFEVTQLRPLLFFFPNVFEALYFYYLFYFKLGKNISFPSISSSTLAAMVILIPSKMTIEYILHIAPTKVMIQLQQFFWNETIRMFSHTFLILFLTVGLSIYIFHNRKIFYILLKDITDEVDTSYRTMIK